MRRDQSQAGADYRRVHNAQMWKEREHIPVIVPTRPVPIPTHLGE